MRFSKFFIIIACLMLLASMVSFSAMAQDEDTPTVGISEHEDFGTILVNAEGMTLYGFDVDDLGVSNCVEECLEAWPPLLVESADELTGDEALLGELGTIEREDGSLQVTYNERPLYTFAEDTAAGDVTGHLVGRTWYVMTDSTVYVNRNADVGWYLVDANGMALYTFANDEPGVSNCTGECATAWPPYIVESADDLSNGFNVQGTLGTIEREDGSLQVTYNEMPLYTFAEDTARGETNGEGAGDVWFTVVPEKVVLGGNEELGEFLVAANGLTLYTFTEDEPGVSNCTGECAASWTPYTLRPGVKLALGEGLTGELDTIEREDGSLQVTYNGMPLYFWEGDFLPGDTTGHELGDVWFVALP
jgi:predicted lipoprotein with Yx(FWY)xxD motif